MKYEEWLREKDPAEYQRFVAMVAWTRALSQIVAWFERTTPEEGVVR